MQSSVIDDGAKQLNVGINVGIKQGCLLLHTEENAVKAIFLKMEACLNNLTNVSIKGILTLVILLMRLLIRKFFRDEAYHSRTAVQSFYLFALFHLFCPNGGVRAFDAFFFGYLFGQNIC